MIQIIENTDNESIDPIKELSDARMSLFAVMYALKDGILHKRLNDAVKIIDQAQVDIAEMIRADALLNVDVRGVIVNRG